MLSAGGCEGRSRKPELLEALEKLDEVVRGQEVELKATNEALHTASSAFAQRDMHTAARSLPRASASARGVRETERGAVGAGHIAIAMLAMAKAGAAGNLKAAEARALQDSMVDTLLQIARTAEHVPASPPPSLLLILLVGDTAARCCRSACFATL